MEQSQFDAILFHERNIKPRDLPSKEQRRPDQVYIHYNLESPIWSNLNSSGTKDDEEKDEREKMKMKTINTETRPPSNLLPP